MSGIVYMLTVISHRLWEPPRSLRQSAWLCRRGVQGRRYLAALLLWSLVYEVHELVKLRSDDNLCAAVALLSDSSVVRCDRVILSTSASSKAFRVHSVLCLQSLYDT